MDGTSKCCLHCKCYQRLVLLNLAYILMFTVLFGDLCLRYGSSHPNTEDLMKDTRIVHKRSSLPAHFIPRELRSQHFPPPDERPQDPQDLMAPIPVRSVESMTTTAPQMVPRRNPPDAVTKHPKTSTRKRKSKKKRINQTRGQAIKANALPGSSSYIRWGRQTCPKESTVIYTGYAVGSYPLRGFAGMSELLCLPLDPSWQNNSSIQTPSKVLVTAAKLSLDDSDALPSEVENGVIKCAVCVIERTPVVMIPGMSSCPDGWITEYSGFLMSSPGISNEYYTGGKGHCVDNSPEVYTGHKDTLSPKLTFTQAGHCYKDLEPCDVYTLSRKLACAVCSK